MFAIKYYVLLAAAASASAGAGKIYLTLKCIGATSSYSNTDCEALGDVEGCYHLSVVYKFQSCSYLCNEATVDTIQEVRCKKFCPDYWTNACSAIPQLFINLQSETSTAAPRDILAPSTASAARSEERATSQVDTLDQLATDSDDAVFLLLVFSSALVSVASVCFLVVCIVCVCTESSSKRCCRSSREGEELQYVYVDRAKPDSENQQNADGEDVYPNLTVATEQEDAVYEKSKLWINPQTAEEYTSS